MSAQQHPPDEVIDRFRNRYRKQHALASALDTVIRLLLPGSRTPPMPGRPRRILLANKGHLGDALMSTALLPAIKHVYPDVFVGFLTGTYSRAAIEGHPWVDKVHLLDHWHAARSAKPLPHRLTAYYGHSMRAMARELRAMNYDIALDLHAWFPNSIPLLWLARIPVRIGFDRVGFSALLTHVQRYSYDRRHEIDHQCDLLRLWGLPQDSLDLARPNLAEIPESARRKARERVGAPGRFRVLHPASSTPVKDWALASWSELAGNLLSQGITPVVTGAGARDQAISRAICDQAPGSIDAVGKLSWADLMALLSAAEMVYSVDTSVGHAAAALGRPVVSIFGGMADPQHWSPRGARVVSNPLACSPCFDKRGCAHRSCLLGVSVRDVEEAAARM